MQLPWFMPLAIAGVAGVVVFGAQAHEGSQPPGAMARLALGASQTSELREWDAQLDRLARSGELVRHGIQQDTVLTDGRVHDRHDQYFNGVRVFGGDVVRQQRNGVTESIFGTVYGDIGIPTDPSIAEDDAVALLRTLGSDRLAANSRPELVVVPRDEGGYALAWRAHVWTTEGWMQTFLDAHTGDIVLQYNDLQTQSAVGTAIGVLGDRKKISTLSSSGRFLADDQLRPPTLITYDMKGSLSRTLDVLFFGLAPTLNDVASDTDNVWTDVSSVDAHVHVGWTYDFLFKRFGRQGLDDRNTPLRAITHPVRRSDIFTAPDEAEDFFLNAFWCGECGADGKGMMMFGEGLPPGVTLGGNSLDYFSGALDVAAHELTHGLTNYSSALVYRNESGALNEAFSDIIGTSVEFFFQPSGPGQRQADYLIGEDIFRPGGFRSLANPAALGDPDHYSRRFIGGADNGGVHTNSGIPNHAFYLAIEGGVNRTSGLTVQGVGAANREQIEKVFYRAFTFMLGSSARFSTARAATIQSARDLYGVNSAAERAVTQAWTAVGVF